MTTTLTQLIFYSFATLWVLSAFGVIISRNPVRGALFLVFAFVMSAGIWLLMQAEFLALVLVLVYVGAVMTLFLFVVMMMNLDQLPSRLGFKKYWPLGLVIFAFIIGLLMYVIRPEHFSLVAIIAPSIEDANNIKSLGSVLYTQYVYAFELAAVILLVAIIAAISLAFRGWGGLSKRQNIHKQVTTNAKDRVRLVKDMKNY